MAEVFEDAFMEAQRNMLEIAYDYVDGRANKLYAFAFYENGENFFDYFFLIRGQLVKRNKVNDTLRPGEEPYDASGDRQVEHMKDGVAELRVIRKACQEYGRPMPVQMKLTYDMEQEELDADYSYDPANTGPDDYRMGDDFCDIWFEEVKASL
jgi:hypothetical protein